jgi:hypothetical protein
VKKKEIRSRRSGKLRIGDDWNAITIIAMSQQSPLKAIAELVENSIDAQAANILITRGKERGQQYLRISDDGSGIPRDGSGLPDFHYVATHICDSLKRRLRREERQGVQGEFGIGLLSFWTLGNELVLTSAGADGKTYEMRMGKGDPHFTIAERRRLFPEKGTEVMIRPLLPGIRNLSGEKIQWYLASELRDRIKRTEVRIRVVDRQARTRHEVVPREFSGRLMHELPHVETTLGELYLELYLDDPKPENRVGLYRHGTRVLEDIALLDAFNCTPWNSGSLQGIIDAPFLVLTPGTRTGVLQDERFEKLYRLLEPVATRLIDAIEEQKRAAEEQASKEILHSIHRAFREALLKLPEEEYDWFQVHDGKRDLRSGRRNMGISLSDQGSDQDQTLTAGETHEALQRKFFDFPGPLHNVVISPASCTVRVGESKNFRAIPRDRARRLVEENLEFAWGIVDGGGELENTSSEIVSFRSPNEPGLTRLRLQVRQGERECEAETLITVTDALIPEVPRSPRDSRGLPFYTFERAPGELWRSRYEDAHNLIVINNSHRDFVFASRSRVLKLRYICRLYVKELVYNNFRGISPEHLLERMVELSLYTEENLK